MNVDKEDFLRHTAQFGVTWKATGKLSQRSLKKLMRNLHILLS
jgi:hypothetical protein